MESDAVRLYHEALTDYKEGRAEKAVRTLHNVVTSSPDFDDAFEALSVILYNLGLHDEAIEVLELWVKSNPHTVMAHTNLSRCYVAKGMIPEAEKEQNEARRLTWKSELTRKDVVEIKVDYEEKVAKYKKIIDFDPADVLGYFSLATVYFDNGKKREAMDTFEKAIQVDPKHTSSYWGLGQALEALGDKEKARKIYREGIKVAEEHGDMMPQKKMESRLKALEKE